MERKQGDVQKEHIDIEHKFEGKISHLKIQNKESEERIIDLKRELEEMKSKNREQQSILDLERCQLKEIKKLRMQFDDQQRSTEHLRLWSRSTNSPRANIYRMDEGGFMDINELKRSTASLQGKYTAGGGKSDFEKENISLKSELSEALDNIEELRTLSERYESEKVVDKRTIADLQWEKGSLENEMVSWKAKMEQIQSDLKNLKHEHVHQQDSSYGKLCQDNRKLEKDKELLRKKIFLLENEKVKLEKR
ncbi:uncharacterized protein LOC143043704 [Mytilus galloprovincialis]|uniref:uncharacterized protein LOC143043704 n=1 Tax=Mytilus galloprovincialis TaxID=29158 RepID=UPI003F7CAB8D